jgi:transposase
MDLNEKLFSIALGIEEPLYINKIDFIKGEGELHVYIDFERGSKFVCEACDYKDCTVKDTEEKTWRHLNFFQYKCFLHLRTPYINCANCGSHLFVPVWGRARSGFTLLFEAMVLTMAREMPVSAIAEIVGEQDTRLWRILQFHVGKAYKEKDLSALKKVGVDETSSQKGHKYVSVFIDMDTKETVYATEGKDAGTIAAFSEELPKHNGNTANITALSMDMSVSFISGAKKHFPSATITFDKFHVVKQLNEAIDEIRRTEQKSNPVLKGSRYIWLKNPDNLTEGQKKNLSTLAKENKKLSRAYQMKLTFQDIYRTVTDYETADFAIKKWLQWAVRSRLGPIKCFARMVKSHYTGILQYFKTRLTAGVSEGANSRIQEIKRRAKGFRNINNFISMIYLEGSNLSLPSYASGRVK